MGEIERGLDADAIFLMDQVEAFSEARLRELVAVQKSIAEDYGDNTSPMVLATMLADAVDTLGGDTGRFNTHISNILAIAVKVLIQQGWPDNEPVSIAG